MSTTDWGQDPGPKADFTEIVAANLRELIAQNRTTQKELADKLNITAASMTDYCKGRRLPNVEFFVALKNLYGISIDDFLTKRFFPAQKRSAPREAAVNTEVQTVYQKYCGTYFVYYFDTSKYKGGDNLLPRESLLYGVLSIYEAPTYLDTPEYGCMAVLGIHERSAAAALKQKMEALETPAQIAEFIDGQYANTAYYGDFELSQEHAFVSMSHASRDKALIIFHRVDSNKANYAGGVGTINSVSKGRERMPVVQFMGISRYPLSMSEEEIHHSLLLNDPTFKAESETEEMIQTFKALYVVDDVPKYQFSELQKAMVIRSTLERCIKKSLERNMFRYGKVSERDDDDWYHSIKDSSVLNE